MRVAERFMRPPWEDEGEVIAAGNTLAPSTGWAKLAASNMNSNQGYPMEL